MENLGERYCNSCLVGCIGFITFVAICCSNGLFIFLGITGYCHCHFFPSFGLSISLSLTVNYLFISLHFVSLDPRLLMWFCLLVNVTWLVLWIDKNLNLNSNLNFKLLLSVPDRNFVPLSVIDRNSQFFLLVQVFYPKIPVV